MVSQVGRRGWRFGAQRRLKRTLLAQKRPPPSPRDLVACDGLSRVPPPPDPYVEVLAPVAHKCDRIWIQGL